jgi:ATP-binding cassette subfamily B protein
MPRRAEFLRSRQRLFVPEVVQTSAMDCGPAALKSLLAGFGIDASYARLQEACQVNVDGTSINTIEQLARTFGLHAEQIMLPVDHVLRPSARALPALAVVAREGATHFVIVWRRVGPWVQIMDPAKGRRWVAVRAFESELYVHAERVPADGWRQWAATAEPLATLTDRLAALDVPGVARDLLVQGALADRGWRALAALDAATRMTADMARRDRAVRGAAAGQVILSLARHAGDPTTRRALIPAAYWSVLPDRAHPESPHVVLRGAVLVAIRGVRADPHAASGAADGRQARAAPAAGAPAPLVAAVAAAVTRAPERPFCDIWRAVRGSGAVPPALVAGAIAIAAAGALLEILLLRGMLEIGQTLALREQRLVGATMLLGTVAALSVLDAAITSSVLNLGRRVEARFRAQLFAKLPRLRDQFFRSRLLSDMALRAHSLEDLRRLPEIAAGLLRSGTQLVLTAFALSWLDQPSRWLAALAAACAIAIPLAAGRLLGERDLRQRVHGASLSRLYLDSLVGLVAARVHGAEPALRRRHEAELVQWARSGMRLLRAAVLVEALQMLIGISIAAWLVIGFIGRGAAPGALLLFVFWALSMPVLGRDVASAVRRLPACRNVARRVLELLHAPEQPASPAAEPAPGTAGVRVSFEAVDVTLGGRNVLRDVTLTLDAGEHVAIVGRSGAGKSTLVGLLLGWNMPSHGRLLVDDAPLDEPRLAALRERTAWVDPSVQLWNSSLLDNLRYGEPESERRDVGGLIQDADLLDVLQKLPSGLQSRLGEGGRLTSGGEAQRVRFGRALGRAGARLVVLDEPFRGLDRARRADLLRRARQRWQQATLVAVTHDIKETLTFARVIVVDHGRIVEDGAPAALAAAADSIYATLLAAERAVEARLFADPSWRRWQIRQGAVVEDPNAPAVRPARVAGGVEAVASAADEPVAAAPGMPQPQFEPPSPRGAPARQGVVRPPAAAAADQGAGGPGGGGPMASARRVRWRESVRQIGIAASIALCVAATLLVLNPLRPASEPVPEAASAPAPQQAPAVSPPPSSPAPLESMNAHARTVMPSAPLAEPAGSRPARSAGADRSAAIPSDREQVAAPAAGRTESVTRPSVPAMVGAGRSVPPPAPVNIQPPPRLPVTAVRTDARLTPADVMLRPPAAAAPAAPRIAASSMTDDEAIRRVLSLYERSYDRLDAASVAAVWRGLDSRGLERAFGTLASQDLAFDRCELDIEGDRAIAECRGALRYVPRIGGASPQERQLSWTFDLQQDEGRWHIATVNAR